MNVEELFKAQFNQLRKEDQTKYFLMKVERVKFAEGNPDVFQAYGVRADNGKPVMVQSQKSSSGQHLPESGGILRADKVARITSAKPSDITSYKAEYFHAYRQDDFCVQAVVQAARPTKDQQSGMWSAQVHAFDLDTNVLMVAGNRIVSDIEKALLVALRPWVAKSQSKITHDIKGDSLWGDGQAAVPGLSPFAMVRFAGQSFKVYGSAAVKEGQGDNAQYRLPTDMELVQRIRNNTNVQNLKEIASQIAPEQLETLAIAIIPGVSMQVGRESLSGATQKYLAIPEAFNWENRDKLDPTGKPTSQPGYRLADVHVKMSRAGRMMVVDAVPSAGGTLSKFLPESTREQQIRAAREAATQGQQAEAQPAPAPVPAAAQPTAAPAAKPAAAKPSQAAAQPAPAPAAAEPHFAADPAPNAFDQPEPDVDDYAAYAGDFAAMEAMNASGQDEDFDALFAEAEQRQTQRRAPRPGM